VNDAIYTLNSVMNMALQVCNFANDR